MGLAFYNSVALDINFTGALYKKILNVPLTLNDVCEFDPSLGAGLKQLLEYEGDVKTDYQRTFSVEVVDPLGKLNSFDLVPNGSEILVDLTNRQGYGF